MTPSPLELRGRGSLLHPDGQLLAVVDCYILQEMDESGQQHWRGFCQVQAVHGLQPGRERLLLQLDRGPSAELDASVSLEADSHSLRVTFRNARPRPMAGASLDERLRVGVIGPGAMGCLFGARLAMAGHEVWMLCRRPEQAELLDERGLIYERDGATQRVPVRATADPRAAHPLDLALVLVKAHATHQAATMLIPALGGVTWVATLQNGLGNVDALAEVLGRERLLAGVSSQGATLLGPGQVRHAGFGPNALTDVVGGRSARATWLAEVLTAAGLPTTVEADLAPLIWSKLVANTAINALTALTGRCNGELLDSPVAGLFDDLAYETAGVAEALGVELPFADAAEHARKVARITAANRSSMLQDIEAGRPTEIGALNEAVAAEGVRLGVRTPCNRAVSALVRDLEQRSSSGR